jgi:hypothetical protein
MSAANRRVRAIGLDVGVVAVVGAGLLAVFRGPGDSTAICVSAAVAVIVQVLASVLGEAAGGQGNPAGRIGIGALVRFLALVAYAVLVATALRLPPPAALVSLALFFFLTTLLEPLLIKP